MPFFSYKRYPKTKKWQTLFGGVTSPKILGLSNCLILVEQQYFVGDTASQSTKWLDTLKIRGGTDPLTTPTTPFSYFPGQTTRISHRGKPAVQVTLVGDTSGSVKTCDFVKICFHLPFRLLVRNTTSLLFTFRTKTNQEKATFWRDEPETAHFITDHRTTIPRFLDIQAN